MSDSISYLERQMATLELEIAAARALHHWNRYGMFCSECGQGWPCRTAVALGEKQLTSRERLASRASRRKQSPSTAKDGAA